MIDSAKLIEYLEGKIAAELLQAIKERLVVAPLHRSIGEAHVTLVRGLDAIEREAAAENWRATCAEMEFIASRASEKQEEKALKGLLRLEGE